MTKIRRLYRTETEKETSDYKNTSGNGWSCLCQAVCRWF